MKVLHFICSTGFYGAERWILALANSIDRQRVESQLAVTRESSSHQLALTRHFRALDLPVHEIDMRGRFDVRVIGRLCRIIESEGIDILHTHGYKSDILGVVAARRTGIASLCTPHGFENARDLKLRLYIWAGCQSFRFFDRIAPLSRQLQTDVEAAGVDVARIRYIPNGVDLKPVEAILQRRPPRAQRQEGGQALVIGFIGQLIGRKNVRDILDIFDAVAASHDKVRLRILGDGDAAPELKAHAATLASASRIEFAGFVDEPLTHLAEFDLFVLTSSLEGIPRCIMESMAMGVPIAAYDIPGVDQLITHDDTGLLAPLGDKVRLQALWESLLFDSALATRIASHARQRVNAEFSAQRMARDYLDVYCELVNEKRCGDTLRSPDHS